MNLCIVYLLFTCKPHVYLHQQFLKKNNNNFSIEINLCDGCQLYKQYNLKKKFRDQYK